MVALNIRELIDLAIGSPGPGHVNFKALHLLLSSFAVKLQMMNEPVNFSNYNATDEAGSGRQQSKEGRQNRKSKGKPRNGRLTGGAPPEEEEETEFEGANEEAIEEENELMADTENMTTASEKEVDDEPEEPEPRDNTPTSEVEVVDNGQSTIQVDSMSVNKNLYEEEPKTFTPPSSINLGSKASEDEMSLHFADIKGGDIYHGIAIMKDQLELTMEQVLLLTEITIAKRATAQGIGVLRAISKKLTAIKKENIYIENAYGFRLGGNIYDGELDIADVEEIEEGISEQSPSSPRLSQVHLGQKQYEQFELDVHLCYSPEKLLDQFLELKSEVCIVKSKFKQFQATVVDQERERTAKFINDLEKKVKDIMSDISGYAEKAFILEAIGNNHAKLISQLQETIIDLKIDKMDKTDLSKMLASKADSRDMERKVSLDYVHEMQCRMDKQLCDVRKSITINEKNMYDLLENLRTTLGLTSVEDMLRRFKEKIDEDMNGLRETLRKYMDMTNDDCVAAGARMRVLKNLACISCDTPCVMHTTERAKVPMFPDVRCYTPGPLVTNEQSSIRKSGIIGYYRKDEFPNTISAWKNKQKAPLKKCVPRHAGGPHTTNTANDRVMKVTHSKKLI